MQGQWVDSGMKKQEDGPAWGTWHIYSRGTEDRLFNRLFITRKFLHHLIEHLSKAAWKGRPPAQRHCPQALQCQGKSDHLKGKCPRTAADTLISPMPHWSTRVLAMPNQACTTAEETDWDGRLIASIRQNSHGSSPVLNRETLIFTQRNIHQLRPVQHLLP